jgi:uncharacterized protein
VPIAARARRSTRSVARGALQVADPLGSPAVPIWVDADACPKVITDLLCRAADRHKVTLTLVSHQPLRISPSPVMTVLRVPAGFDGADHAIVPHVRTGDLVVTADLLLVAQVLAQGARGIPAHLTMRSVLDEPRQRSVATGGRHPSARATGRPLPITWIGG